MKRSVLFVALLATAVAAQAADKPFKIPTDAKAKYWVLEMGGQWPNRTIVTKRVGSSGTSYSKRLYDCANSTVKYLGSGDTLADMANSKPDKKMAPIVPESIADYVGRRACKR
jgi:hypothetical protein